MDWFGEHVKWHQKVLKFVKHDGQVANKPWARNSCFLIA